MEAKLRWFGHVNKQYLDDVDTHTFSPAARGVNLAKLPPNQVIADFGRGSNVE